MLCFQSVLYCIVLYNDVFTFVYVAVGNKLLLLLLLLLLQITMNTSTKRGRKFRIVVDKMASLTEMFPPKNTCKISSFSLANKKQLMMQMRQTAE